jgi:hypothetical protein
MRRYILLVIYFALPFSIIAQSNFSDFISMKGKKFVDGNGSVYFPLALVYWLDIIYENNQYYISPMVYYGANTNPYCPPVCYEGGCPNCDQQALNLQMSSDFIRIKNLGYNTVRIVGFAPRFTKCPDDDLTNDPCVSPTYVNDQQKCFTIGRFNSLGCCPLQRQPLDITGNGPTSELKLTDLISMYQNVIDLADQAGLRSFLDVGSIDMGDLSDPTFSTPDPAAVSAYGNYLGAISSGLASKTALIGFDLFGEPGGYGANGPGDGINARKNFICDASQQWYEAVKTNSTSANRPNGILVSYGLQTPDGDTHEWDEGMVAVDYLAFHPYAFRKLGAPYIDLTRALEANLSNIKWYSENIHTPWMIGETGIGGSDNPSSLSDCQVSPMNTIDGTQQNQLDYFLDMYQKVHDYGGAGLTMWQYHEVYWSSSIPNPNPPPLTLYPMCYHDGFGVIDRNDNPKLAASTFQNINYFAQPPYSPSNYYDISGLASNPPSTNCINGTVKESTAGNPPIKDVSLVGFVKDPNTGSFGSPNPPLSDPNLTGLTQTFSQPNGTFFICNGLPTHAPSDNYNIGILRVGGIGTNTFDDGFPANNKIYNLSFSSVAKSFNLNNITVPVSQTYSPPPVTYNYISANNWLIDGNGTSGGNAEFKAGGEITLTEFEVKRGGEFWAHYGLGQVDCSDNAFLRTLNNNMGSIHQSTIAHNNSLFSIKLKPAAEYQQQSNNQWASVFPNPAANGKAAVTVSGISNFSEIIITDVMGKTIKQIKVQGLITPIDISENAKGIYFIKIIGQENIIVKKLIYQ